MRVAIIGTGLIGTSIALGIRRGASDDVVVGYDREPQHVDHARKLGALNEGARTLLDAVRDADLVVLALPVLAIEKTLGEIGPHLKRGAVVTDTGSSKASVLRTAQRELPDHVDFVGGHPMAGKTEFGPAAGDAGLFQDRRWVIVPAVSASERSVNLVSGVAELLGARTMLMDAEEHDAYVAAVSHMPMLAAIALFSTARASEAWPELSLLAAGGFESMTRLAGTDPAMSYDLALTNRDNIAHWIDRYVVSLQELRRRLLDAEGEDDFYRLLAATEHDQGMFTHGQRGRQEESNLDNADAGGSFQDFIAGAWVREKFNEVMKDSEERLRLMDEEERARRRV